MISKANGKEHIKDEVEVIFVSSDEDSKGFKDYHSEMSFPAIPYEKRDVKSKLCEKFEVEGIPHLVAIDPLTGEKLSINENVDLKAFITQHGAGAFPPSASNIEEKRLEVEKKKSDALFKISADDSVTISTPSSAMLTSNKTCVEKNITVKSLLDENEYVAFVLGDGDKNDEKYSKVLEAKATLGGNKFIPIYIGWTEYGDEPDHMALFERFYSIREDDLSDEVRSTLIDLLGKDVKYQTMITIRKGRGVCGLDGKCEENGVPVIVSVDEGLSFLSKFGVSAFPWDKTSIKEAEERKDRRVKDLKDNLSDFNFLRLKTAENRKNNNVLVRGLIDKKDDTKDSPPRKSISVDDIFASKDVDSTDSSILGLYFSAHWCPPCRRLTPKLLETYEEIRSKKGSDRFEVIFISFDDNEDEFNNYYNSMVTPTTKEQWLSLDYNNRELANDLSEAFSVGGFPTLILLKSDGTIVSDDAAKKLEFGADYFPWDTESLKRRNDKLLKKEEEDIEAQRKHEDGVVVKRIIGPSGSITYDANSRFLEFKGTFPTAVLDENVAAKGVLYYEVEIINNDGCAQFGFAAKNAFEQKDCYWDEGVGDNGRSWGVDGFRRTLWHDGEYGKMECGWEVGDVIGLAMNIDIGKIAYSKNGNWSKEAGCGVVFEKCSSKEDDGVGFYPSLTSSSLKVRLNVTEKHLRYSKPSEEVW